MNGPTKIATALVLGGALAAIAHPGVASAQSAAPGTARLTIRSPWGPESVVLVPDAPAPRRYLCDTPCTLRVAPGAIRLALSGTRLFTFDVPREGASVVATAQTEASYARFEAGRRSLSLRPAPHDHTVRNIAIGVGVSLGATALVLAGLVLLAVETRAFAGFAGP